MFPLFVLSGNDYVRDDNRISGQTGLSCGLKTSLFRLKLMPVIQFAVSGVVCLSVCLDACQVICMR